MLLTGLYILDHDVPADWLCSFAGAIWFLHPVFEKAWREALKRKVEMVRHARISSAFAAGCGG